MAQMARRAIRDKILASLSPATAHSGSENFPALPLETISPSGSDSEERKSSLYQTHLIHLRKISLKLSTQVKLI
ncbi:MAG: hypothetical protein L3J59_04440 [Methylococcaceae bacterium]|nr:hypothetical protein [Methylococcaceae bacterium]